MCFCLARVIVFGASNDLKGVKLMLLVSFLKHMLLVLVRTTSIRGEAVLMSFHRLYFEQKKKLEYYYNFSIFDFHRCKIEVFLMYNHRCGCTWCALFILNNRFRYV